MQNLARHGISRQGSNSPQVTAAALTSKITASTSAHRSEIATNPQILYETQLEELMHLNEFLHQTTENPYFAQNASD